MIGVPLIHQEKSMACWHASARMIYEYKRRACADPLPDTYTSNTGITANDFIRLAKALGLQTLPKVSTTYNWTFIDSMLRRYGPIWAAGNWNGAPHIIVVTGADSDGTLYVNDPAFYMPQTRDIEWFNERIATEVPVPMMYLL